MRSLVRSSGRLFRSILLLELLQCAFFNHFSTVPINAATTYRENQRNVAEMAALVGSMARFRQLLVTTQVDEITKDKPQEGQEQTAEPEVDEHHKDKTDKSEQTTSGRVKSADEPQFEQFKAVVHEDETEQVADGSSQAEENFNSENLNPMLLEKTDELQQQVIKEVKEIEETTVKEDGELRSQADNQEQQHRDEHDERKESMDQENREEKEDSMPEQSRIEEQHQEHEPFVFPEPYLLGPTIKDWDEQRESWLNENPHLKINSDGKPRVLIVTGSQPEPCHSSVGDNFLIKALKLKIDYARMHNYEIYYNLAWLDPLFGSFWVKLPTIRTLMLSHPEIEWFFWIDSDATFTDMLFEAPWEKYEGYNMIMWGMNDYFYAERQWTALNAGVFMLRNCQWSLDLIDKWSPMGPDGPVRVAYGKILTAFLKDRNDWEADDQSALAYLMITDEAVKAKVKLVDSGEYLLSGWWVPLVGTFEGLMEKYHPGLGNHKWPWVVHFTGCGPCHQDDTTPQFKNCMKNIDRAFHFADNQVLAYMGFQHQSLESPELIRIRNDTDRPLELLGVNPWAERIAEVAAAAGGTS